MNRPLPFVAAVRLAIATAALTCLTVPISAAAQSLAGDALIGALQQGGHVLVMRHAESPRGLPPPQQRTPGNVRGERQLSADGQAQMTAMGYAFRVLNLPVGRTLASPAYRAVESAEYFGFGELVRTPELAPDGDAAWLARRVGDAPPDGVNTLLITHAGLIRDAFGDAAEDIAPGEALVFRAAAGYDAALVARVTIRDWATMAVN